ncbi:MAG: xanthine dehydrogenase family protein molybdopterin-binding subunit [Pseudomonadota bacterium]
MSIQANRRDFLKGAAALTTALVVGVRPDGAVAAGNAADLNPFVRISPDGAVTVIIKHFEMGQGTSTGLATLVAEELDADWQTLSIEFAPADNGRYANLFFGSQGTGGSTAIPNSFMQYRKAGAAAREMLCKAAEEKWGVAAHEMTVERGVITSGNRTGTFADFVEIAKTITPSEEPVLKDPKSFRLIGDTALSRQDSKGKTDGTAVFAMDVAVEGMVYATILRSPRFGGRLVSFDASAAEERLGFLSAKALANGAALAIFATSTWEAISARDLVEAEWDFSAAENRSTNELIAYHQGLLEQPEYQARKGGDLGQTGAALSKAAEIVETDFVFPNLAHAPMEPLNCVIEAQGDGVLIHDGCQFPGITQPVIAAVLGLPPEKVAINTVYAGGSFGRRATPIADYQVEAALAFDALGRRTPVKLVWTREDDLRGGFYRPMAAHRARIGFDESGHIVGWDHRIAVKSILKGTAFESVLVHDGIDDVSVEGVHDTHYAIPALSVGLSDAQSQISVLWWRSVGHTHNAYVMESLIDMAAAKAGADPVAFRLDLLSGGTDDQKRLGGVLRHVAEKAGWGQTLPDGHAQGVAVHKSFNSYVAQVAEISTDAEGVVKIEKVTCAVDCGIAINPDVVKAQMEGGIGYGLGAVMRNQITFTEGEVDQINFPDYEPLRITDMPAIDVHIVDSDIAPTGVGEPGVPPIGPALANAIFAATGKRVTRLPMSESGIEFA